MTKYNTSNLENSDIYKKNQLIKPNHHSIEQKSTLRRHSILSSKKRSLSVERGRHVALLGILHPNESTSGFMRLCADRYMRGIGNLTFPNDVHNPRRSRPGNMPARRDEIRASVYAIGIFPYRIYCGCAMLAFV